MVVWSVAKSLILEFVRNRVVRRLRLVAFLSRITKDVYSATKGSSDCTPRVFGYTRLRCGGGAEKQMAFFGDQSVSSPPGGGPRVRANIRWSIMEGYFD